jgi:hypothetical protein
MSFEFRPLQNHKNMVKTSSSGIVDLTFDNGCNAQALWLSPQHTSPQALEILQLNHLHPTLVVIGGAGLMSPDSLQRLQTIFNDALAPLATDMNLTVLDGGTDSGVIQMMGRARQATGGQFPLIGVVPQGKAQLPNFHESGDADSLHALEPHHTSFFLIPGDEWGSESRWLADFASLIASGQKSLTVLINGGKIALTDLQANLATGRPAIVMSGSGRLADTITAVMAGTPPEDVDPQIVELVKTYEPQGKLMRLDLSDPLPEIYQRLKQYFE